MVLVLWGSLCYSKEWVWNLRTKLTDNFCSYHVKVAERLTNRFTI